MQPDPEEKQSANYSAEPFPVWLVDRRQFDFAYRPSIVKNTTGEEAGTIVIDTNRRQLYLVENKERAMRYGIAVGKTGYAWKGRATVGRKAAWPPWYPTDDMKRTYPGLPTRIAPGADNPLGARALYLYQDGRDTLYRIHGTAEPWSIGTSSSSGCIRMFNEDVIALYDKVAPGTKVVVK